jgi:adenosylhomocysteine nucleosidase
VRLLLIVSLAASGTISGCAASNDTPLPGPPPTPSAYLDPTPRVAVMSAIDAELALLVERTQIIRTIRINGRDHHVGRLAGLEVVLTLSGVSMINAAMNTQLLLDRFHITAIVFSGIAGGVNPNLGVGDVTVPAQWGQHQEVVFARETASGWDDRGMGGGFENFDMMFPRRQHVMREGERDDGQRRRFWFPADPEMLAVARQVAAQIELPRCTPSGDCLDRVPVVVVGGNGLSGPSFVDNAGYREWMWRTFAADAVDMESAAVAHVAHSNWIPYVVFRSLSDLAGGSPDADRIRVFFELAATNSAEVLLGFLEAWASRVAPEM